MEHGIKLSNLTTYARPPPPPPPLLQGEAGGGGGGGGSAANNVFVCGVVHDHPPPLHMEKQRRSNSRAHILTYCQVLTYLLGNVAPDPPPLTVCKSSCPSTAPPPNHLQFKLS